MSRLIDADELIKYIKIWEIGTSISSDQKEFIDCVNKQPTAFDIDDVVAQIYRLFFSVKFLKHVPQLFHRPVIEYTQKCYYGVL